MMSRGEVFAPHIGRPISNTRIYILDTYGVPVPIGVSGELYIGGAGVARGYLNLPELTAERFLRDPFATEPGARMYKTGDLGRWLADGNIEFLGRNDFQVKIRGFRIELGEIEARLAEHAAVREAVVIAREDAPGEKRLVAYYTPHGQDREAPGAELLRTYLTAVLPEYMVPAAYVCLDTLPLTPNGKLDRKALPAPGAEAYSVRTYEAPQGEIETALATIWADLLKLDRIGRHDNFFELGGHSLLAVRVISRIRQALNMEVPLGALFTHPVLADFVHGLAGATGVELPSIVRTDRGERISLSFAQLRLWFLAQMDGGSEAYHIPFSLRLSGDLDARALRQALNRILARHEALRTTFVSEDGDPVQRIADEQDSCFQLIEHDLRHHADGQIELDYLIAEEARTPFDLEVGPLIRGRLLRHADTEYTLTITMHHIVSDGWSMGVLLHELSVLYDAFLQGEADPLPELSLQYADYSAWQRRWIEGDLLQQQADYWRTTLAGAPALLELPTDHRRPAERDYAGAFLPFALDEMLTAELRELSRRNGTTLYTTLLAAWAVLMARLSGQQDIVIGTPVANRGRAEIEGMIGFFVNTLALRIDLSESPTVNELLGRVKAQTIAAQQHQDIPFEQVVEIAHPIRTFAHSPLFQAMFAWENNTKESFTLTGLEVQPLQSNSHVVAKFDLTLSLSEGDRTIAGGIEYATSLFEQSTLERYLGYLRTLLQAMAADESQTIDRLTLLPASERHQLLYEWNDTAAEFPSDKCIHELFQEQVDRTPDATAVVFEEASLSYGELNRRANQLAHHLRELGVRPDARVAICVERGFEMIVALLAVLKAGGAYVPLDPTYPVERLRYMLDDSAPTALLTQTHLRQLFSAYGEDLPVLDLADPTPPWNNQPETNPSAADIALTPEHLAYVIYTSGSTGTPKGVMVQHRGLCNRFNWMQLAYELNLQDSVLQKTPFSFDVSTWEF